MSKAYFLLVPLIAAVLAFLAAGQQCPQGFTLTGGVCVANGGVGPVGPTGPAGPGNTPNQNLRPIAVTFSGNGSPLSGTLTDCQEITSGGAINAVYTTADVSGSATIGISTAAFASYTGTAGAPYTSIVGAAPPSLAGAARYTDSTLTGWTTSLTAGAE